MFNIPKEVKDVVAKLEKSGFEAYVVGGCVRDLLLGVKPKDWDITTSAKPEEILELFPESFYENKFLTATVKTGSEDPVLAEIEVTTFRAEGKYTDKRHPDEVRFAKTLEEDLSRRDFTVNSAALELLKSDFNKEKSDFGVRLLDPYNGQIDLDKKLIRSVGDSEERFEEDALRMMRAVRLAVQLDFKIEKKTEATIKKLAGNLEFIAKERARDELVKIIMTPKAKEGIELLNEVGLLKYIIPELGEGIGVENRPKIFYIWEHNLRALDYGAKKDFTLDVRLAALLHDVGKPRTKGPEKNGEWTFYGHDVVGARMTAQIMERLKFSHGETEKICKLVRWHLFKYDVEEDVATTDSSIRRLIRKVGAENMEDLVKLRICDRMGMGVPKAIPYRLRHFQFRVEKILREEEAPTPKMLKVNGEDIMKILSIEPGPRIGQILEVLLQEVIDKPAKNTKEGLGVRVKELGELSEKELVKMAEKAETKVGVVEDERVSKIKAKYYVK